MILVLFCILFIIIIFLLIKGSLLFSKFIIYKNQYYEIKVPYNFREEIGNLLDNFPNRKASFVYGLYTNLSCMSHYDCADNFNEGFLVDIVVNDIEGLSIKDFVIKNTGQNFPEPIILYEDGSVGAKYKLIPARKNRGEGFVQISYSNNKESGRRYYFSNKKYFYYIDVSFRISREDYEMKKSRSYEDFYNKYNNIIEEIIDSFQPIKD